MGAGPRMSNTEHGGPLSCTAISTAPPRPPQVGQHAARARGLAQVHSCDSTSLTFGFFICKVGGTAPTFVGEQCCSAYAATMVSSKSTIALPWAATPTHSWGGEGG